MADDIAVAIARWRERAPQIADEIADAWGLTLGEPYTPGFCGHVVRAELDDGTPAVLKVYYPDRESLQEPDALERWNGDGAIRLLARDDDRFALLLERCEPGAFLSSAGGEHALDVLIELMPRLWIDATDFHTLEDETAVWLEDGLAESAPRRRCGRPDSRARAVAGRPRARAPGPSRGQRARGRA